MPGRNRQPTGPPPPPVVARVRIRYAKRERLRFTSHRDVARIVERAVRRAGVPIAFSAGFSPHPRISWLGAAPTGVASEAEYVEFALAVDVDPAALAQALDAALPPGLDVLEAVPAATAGFADRLEASVWRIELPGVEPDEARRAVEALLAATTAPVWRRTKDGRREVDARAALVSAVVEPPEPPDGASSQVSTGESGARATIVLVARQLAPAVRPDDIVTALRSVHAFESSSPPVATRLAQGPLGAVEAGVGDRRGDPVVSPVTDPLEPDRAAAAGSGADADPRAAGPVGVVPVSSPGG